MHDLIVWFDPGRTTGVATWVANSITTVQIANCHMWSGLQDIRTHLDECAAFINHDYRRSMLVGVENFDFRHDERDRDKIDYTPAEVIGSIRVLVANSGTNVEFTRSSAASAKAFWVDDKIRRIGMYTPGQPHAMDALRHLLRYLTFDPDAGLPEVREKLLAKLRPKDLEGTI